MGLRHTVGMSLKRGRAGRTRARLGAYHEDCAEFGITPDLTRWQAGYAKGLEYYCIPELAYAKGKQGEAHGQGPRGASLDLTRPGCSVGAA